MGFLGDSAGQVAVGARGGNRIVPAVAGRGCGHCNETQVKDSVTGRDATGLASNNYIHLQEDGLDDSKLISLHAVNTLIVYIIIILPPQTFFAVG